MPEIDCESMCSMPSTVVEIGALAEEDDPALHVLGRQAGIGPDHDHHRDVDGREDVDLHPLRGHAPEDHDQQAEHRHGEGAPQRESDDPHGVCGSWKWPSGAADARGGRGKRRIS